MAAKKSKKKTTKNSPYRKANMLAAEEKKSNKKLWMTILIVLISAVLVAGIAVATVFIVRNSTRSPERLNEKAAAYLEKNPYYMQITASNGSTNSSLNEQFRQDVTTASVTVNGENYLTTLPQGDVNISYLMYGDTFYVNEGALGIVTKESFKLDRNNYYDDAAYASALAEVEKVKKSNYEKYVTAYLETVNLSDYESFEVTKGTGGSKTLVCSMLTESVASQFGSQYKDNPEFSQYFEGAEVDRRRSTATIVFDAEGRYTAIKTVYSIAVNMSDGTKELIMMNSERTFSYGDAAKLVEPSNEGYNVITYGGDNTKVFDEPFTVTTTVSYNEQKYADVNMSSLKTYLSSSFSSGFGDHVLRVDGENYEISYKNLQGSEGVRYLSTLLGEYLYTTYTTADMQELTKIKAEQYYNYTSYYAGRTGAYDQAVINAIIPMSTRFFNTAQVIENGDGTYTVDYSTLSEDFFYSFYENINSTSSGTVFVPEASGCYYTVKLDKDGRILSSRLKIHVSAVTDTTTMQPVAEAYIVFERTFDYETAASFYKTAKDGEKWVTLPESEDKYELIEEDYSYDDGYGGILDGILGGIVG